MILETDKIIKELKNAGSCIVPFKWEGGCFFLLDQRIIPWKEDWLPCKSWLDCARGISDMVVRGAPAIGITAAFGMALAAKECQKEGENAYSYLIEIGEQMKNARPTAVNLKWAVNRVIESLNGVSVDEFYERALYEAFLIWQEDVHSNIKMGELGGDLLPEKGGVLTHCNAGALATGGYGTALGVIRGAIKKGKQITVFADETRPWLQGARLTAWELIRDKIPVFLNVDNASGLLMKTGKVRAVVVGADRIAANGDVANKIGTYNCACVAMENNINFFVAAPSSTFDSKCKNGDEIPIEVRSEEEILSFGDMQIAPAGVKAYNPVFDITPSHLITAIITEKGILRPPYEESISRIIFKKDN